MGATADGGKELIAVQDGYRESEPSWSELLVDLKQRGLVAEHLSQREALFVALGHCQRIARCTRAAQRSCERGSSGMRT